MSITSVAHRVVEIFNFKKSNSIGGNSSSSGYSVSHKFSAASNCSAYLAEKDVAFNIMRKVSFAPFPFEISENKIAQEEDRFFNKIDKLSRVAAYTEANEIIVKKSKAIFQDRKKSEDMYVCMCEWILKVDIEKIKRSSLTEDIKEIRINNLKELAVSIHKDININELVRTYIKVEKQMRDTVMSEMPNEMRVDMNEAFQSDRGDSYRGAILHNLKVNLDAYSKKNKLYNPQEVMNKSFELSHLHKSS